MIYHEKIQERRDAILKCLEGFQQNLPTVLISKVIERSKTDLPDEFARWAPAVVIASDYLLQAAGHRPRSRRLSGLPRDRVNPEALTTPGIPKGSQESSRG